MEAVRAEDTMRMGDYVVLKRVAVGGMAEIFLARKDGMSGFERLVVLKRILPEYAHNAEFVRMFLNEARIAATLHHTNIVQVHGIGEERGQVFFAMEFLHGEDLSRVLSRANQIGRPPQFDGVLTIASAVCSGLHYAHERCGPDGTALGIVHRDVSPHNVFVTYDGNIKLLDFGIAKATTSFGKTQTGVLKGKVAYMSPEQAYSQPVDRKSDIFCMGILLWELTTGRRLYRRRSELETLKALVDADAPKPSTVVSSYPAELEDIVMKCLSRDPAGRYESCEVLSEALERFAKSQSLQVSPLIATRMMRSLFKSEISAFETAVKSGANLVEQVVARMELTAKKESIDDWDSNVASVIVDIGSDPDKTSLTPSRSVVVMDPDTETTAVEQAPRRPELAAKEATIPAPPIEPAPSPPSLPLPGMPVVRPSTPLPMAAAVAAPRAAPVTTPTPTPMPPPVVVPSFEPGQRTDPTEPVRQRDDWTERLQSQPSLEEPAYHTKRARWPIIAGVAVAGIAIAIIVAMSGGGGAKPAAEPVATRPVTESKPEARPAIAAPEAPTIQTVKPEPTTIAAKPEPTTITAKPELKTAIAAKPVAPRPAIVAPKPEVKAPPKKPEPKVAARPVAAKPEIKAVPKKPEPKKPEPKKPEPKKPTAKDLDSLPL